MTVRVVFMGTPEFAVPSLRALSEACDVVGVFTRPDAVSGRGGKTHPSPVAAAADSLRIPVYKPPTLRSEGALETLVSLSPDLLVVAAYGLILPAAVLGVAPRGAVNVHASLLPRWRGAAPIQRALLAGDLETGVSIMRMEEGLDTGPYCLQVATPIRDADARQLTERLAQIGADALIDALPAIADGSASWTEQDESLVTYADKIAKRDVAISPDLTTDEAWRRLRAASSAAPSRAVLAGRPVTLLSAVPTTPDAATPPSGRLACTKSGVLVGLADGALLLSTVKPDGKAEMAAADWSRGVRDLDGASWEAIR